MGSSGRAVERRTVNRGDGGSIPPTTVTKLRQFLFTPHLPVSFGRDTKNRWSLLSGVYARGSKRSHTGGKCVTCSGLTNSRWTLNALQRAPSSIWEKEKGKKHLLLTGSQVFDSLVKGIIHACFKNILESDIVIYVSICYVYYIQLLYKHYSNIIKSQMCLTEYLSALDSTENKLVVYITYCRLY